MGESSRLLIKEKTNKETRKTLKQLNISAKAKLASKVSHSTWEFGLIWIEHTLCLWQGLLTQLPWLNPNGKRVKCLLGCKHETNWRPIQWAMHDITCFTWRSFLLHPNSNFIYLLTYLFIHPFFVKFIDLFGLYCPYVFLTAFILSCLKAIKVHCQI